MSYQFALEAACACHPGKVRRNNEDNYLFDSVCLPADNHGLHTPSVYRCELKNDVCFAVFDGMGGENFGELAAYAAAACLKRLTAGKKDFFSPDVESVTELVSEMNDAVVAKARTLCTEHMGTTLAALFFHRNSAYVCNLGDSRAYRLQDGFMQQLTVDHLERRSDLSGRKRPLTQHLGIPSDVLTLNPHIAKGKLERGDQFLLCSDGLSDMLNDAEIRHIWESASGPAQCVNDLVAAALANGGRDNVTVIVCRVC